MQWLVRRNPIARDMLARLGMALFLLALHAPARAQSSATGAAGGEDGSRIDRLEQMLKSVVEENRRLSDEVRGLKEQLNARPADTTAQTGSSPNPPAIQPQSGQPPETRNSADASEEVPVFPQTLGDSRPSSSTAQWFSPTGPFYSPTPPSPESRKLFDTFYRLGYDNGFVIAPEDFSASPFALKVNNQNQFRYSGFARGADSWTDSAGTVRTIANTSNFLIPRGRLILSGKAFFPELSYLLNIDYNTVGSFPIGFRAYALSYRFGPELELSVGQNKVPGSREWLGSAFVGQEGPDRSMATTFFRPSLSQGIWITGEPVEGLHYHAMLSNGFNTLNVATSRLDNRFCWSGSVWWEPWGEFGPSYPDIEAHEQLVTRLGGSYTFDVGAGSQANSGAPENSAIRLSDGTLLTQTGAFAPGVTLQRFDLSLAAIDLAFKYRGWSLSTEMYAQDLLGLVGDGPLPFRSTQAYGGVLQGGYFLIPQKVEVYSRTSFVTGHYGSGTELAGGFNWFPLKGRNNLRFTFDTDWLNHNPAEQNRTGFVAGQSGVLVRAQISTSF